MPGPKYRAFEQGELRKFGELFIAPLLHNRPPKQTLDDFLAETIFHKDARIILRCKAKAEFTMPGLWKMTSTKKIQQVQTPRIVKRGAECYVRFDLQETPVRVDVETYMGQGGREYVFELTDLEWIQIKRHLIPCGRGKHDFEKICS